MRVMLQDGLTSVHGTPALIVPEEDPGESPADFLSHLVKVHLPSRAGRTLHGEPISGVRVHVEQGAEENQVDGNHTGPRQLEFPPNMPVSDSAGKYPTV